VPISQTGLFKLLLTVLHDGPEQGLYDWRIPFLANRWDGTRKVTTDELGKRLVKYKAFLPRYGVTLKCEATVGERCKVEVEGEPDEVAAFRTMVEKEQSELLAACGED